MSSEETDKFFNIFVIHQNRVPRGKSIRGNQIHEKFIPKFIDLIIWGHEHESIPEIEVGFYF